MTKVVTVARHDGNLRGKGWSDAARHARALSSKEALDAAGTGAADMMSETFEQLDELLVGLGAGAGRS